MGRRDGRRGAGARPTPRPLPRSAREIVMEASYDGPDITYFFDKRVAPADEPRPAPRAAAGGRAALRGWA